MRLRDVRARDLRASSFITSSLKCLLLLSLVVLVALYGNISWALQRHELLPETTLAKPEDNLKDQSTAHEVATSHTTAEASTPAAHQPAPSQAAEQAHAPTAHEETHVPAASSSAEATHEPAEGGHMAAKPLSGEEGEHGVPIPAEGLPEHDEEAEVHGEHGVVLPKISPVPGVTFVETMINLMDHELSGRTLGWRPNDIIIGRFTDNINNYQLGVLEALRFTTLRLKDSLTRMGDADTYDPDLESALNLLMNRATLFWFPSAENSYREAVDHLKQFLVKLEKGQRHFYYRSDNLLLLVSTYRDLMGNVNRNLIRENVGWFESDDYYYYAKGVAHVYFEILKVVRVGFESQLAQTLDAVAIMDEVLHELYRAEQMDPWLVLDSGPNSFFANHRANLNAPLSEVAHLLVILSQL